MGFPWGRTQGLGMPSPARGPHKGCLLPGQPGLGASLGLLAGPESKGALQTDLQVLLHVSLPPIAITQNISRLVSWDTITCSQVSQF